ncbi:WD_REPEATS_REGION domain-containing protein [Linnemannia gamsii]|uniref:WD_REPEATS_REGION domain-containing protein n=1 Tax=Linnemannia gamsii TaxID=64522 RepID=A0A9P6QU08_9FUNG|nr:WD_REPEATS_REGION domain-containing protein [Linnemannia gamsii]
MINCMVKDLNRTEGHQPLACILTELKDTEDSILQFQVNYALQALQYVPDDESTLQAVLRFAGGVTMGTVGVASICKLDPTNLFNSLDTLRQAAGQSYEVTKSILEAKEVSQKGCSGAMQSLLKGIRAGTRHEWYLTLLAGRMFVRDGRLADFKYTVREAHCRNKRSFQMGVCQILAEIAVDPLWDLVTRRHAVDFLGALYINNGGWKPHPDVKQWILVILAQLSGLSDAIVDAVKEHATSVLQAQNHDGIAIDPSSYPLMSRLPWPESFPLLIRAQKISYVEHDLHMLMKRRLEEAQLQIYISPMAKANLRAPDDELFPLMENVQEFLASDRQVMLILGDLGSGKSTFSRRLEHLLCTEYKRGGPIPLFINLAAIDNPQHDMVSKQLQFHNFNDDQILELKLHRQLVLICDGYDESQLMVNLHRTNSLNQPGQWNTKMIISCRTQYLGQSYLDRFRPQLTDRYKLAPQSVFQEAVIAPFSKEQIQSYIDKYVPLEPSPLCKHNYMYMLNTIPTLMDMVRNPFLLLLALEALPDIVKNTQDLSTIKIARVQLYDTFVNHWLNVNKRRLRGNTLSKEDFDVLEQLEEAGFTAMGVDYSTRLATAMYNHLKGRAIVKYVHLNDKTTWRAEFFGPDPEIRLLREASPLIRSGSYYQFLHRSMLEYFYSCTVVGSRRFESDDEHYPQSDIDSIDVQSLDPACPLFTRDLLTEPSVVQFLSERVQENPSFKTQLFNIIEGSKSDASLAMAAASSITILAKAGVVFRRHDFRGIRIPGADLSGAQFDSAQFQGADLTNVNLGMSWLRNSDFSNAHMEGVQFGELPYLEHPDGVFATCLQLV